MLYENDCEGSFFTRPKHQWGKWKEDGNIVINYGSTKYLIGITQRRQCEKCGKVEIDTQLYETWW